MYLTCPYHFWRWLSLLNLLIYLLFYSSCQADLASETVYLTWQRQPDTTITIQWLSHSDQFNDRIRYQRYDETTWHFVEGTHDSLLPHSGCFLHRVELNGLKPDTDYYFKLDQYDKEYAFRTMPTTLIHPIRFVVGGDMYHDELSLMDQTCRQAAKTNPSFALVGGDIAYAVQKMHSLENTQRWVDWIKIWSQSMVTPGGRLIPVIAVLGNHDLPGQYHQHPTQAKTFSALFPMPGKQIYNVLDFGSYLSVILLDSGHANPIGGKQTNWLNFVLQNRQHVLYRFAIYHIPAYPSIRSFHNRLSAAIRRHWVPLFEKGGIQVAFEHHDHAYKRTYPLLNQHIDPQGVIYVGDGAWGIEKPRKPSIFRRRPFYLNQFASTRHFIVVTLQEKHSHLMTLDDQGRVIDEFLRAIKKNLTH
jgi:hypothetical protein